MKPFNSLIWSFGISLLIMSVLVVTSTDGQKLMENDDDDDEKCEPTLADACFTDVAQDLRCLGSTKRKVQCNDLCRSIDDALQCTADIIDTDCGQKDGRDRFDAWLRGLRAVYYSLCGKDRLAILGLTQNADCWNPMSFVSCVEKMAGIDHVNDLLRLRLDMNQCNRLMISISTCNVKATSLGLASARCSPSLEGVNEIIHTFFSKTECGRVCNGGSNIVFKKTTSVICLSALLLSAVMLQF
ncbi:uncharacterized protein LOC124204926 [Daphnia pulex]|uniref:uncharacterized protein LOC124204926 n=1 Tax=Daphnia pulex TaxID=6669 RepID=UPI001EDFA161|nr:uncharacterized protein LOC124204926 [Daphnia pulex]